MKIDDKIRDQNCNIILTERLKIYWYYHEVKLINILPGKKNYLLAKVD